MPSTGAAKLEAQRKRRLKPHEAPTPNEALRVEAPANMKPLSEALKPSNEAPDEPCNDRGIPYSAYCTAEDLSRHEPLLGMTVGAACIAWRVEKCSPIPLGDGDACVDLPLMLAHNQATDEEKKAAGEWLKQRGWAEKSVMSSRPSPVSAA